MESLRPTIQENGSDFTQLYDFDWSELVSSGARQTLSEKKYNYLKMLPLSEDVFKLNTYLKEKIKELLPKVPDNAAFYSDLAKVTLCRITLFNSKRGGDVQRITVENYNRAIEAQNNIPQDISLQLKSTAKTHAYCIVCKKPGPKLIVVSPECRTAVFIEHNVLIPSGNRCCPGHLENGRFTSAAIQQLPTTDHAFVNRTTILSLLQQMRDLCHKQEKSYLDFDEAKTLTDTDYSSLLGLSKENFHTICDSVKTEVKPTPSRSLKKSVAIFLCKLKTGLSNQILSTLFQTSKSSLRRVISAVRKAMMISFVPHSLGFEHVTREEVINDHTRQLAQTLFGNIEKKQAILVLDGTYIYTAKSNNFHYQRRSYSIHKGRPLIKPMVIVTTTGYFVSILGPYLADNKNNDASILQHIIKTNAEDIRNWLSEDDIFIVDRGWVVESSNARIKRWRYLDKTLPTNQIPFIGDYVRIVCALSNRFFPPLSKSDSNEADDAEAAKMLYLSKQVNNLKQMVQENGLNRRSTQWQTVLECEIQNFPMLDEDQLRNLTCGTYQLKLSRSYIQEHIEGECDISFHKDNDRLLRLKIQSRHTSSKQYLVWIEYSDCSVEAWYCTCRAGARVVGMCSHIAAIIWYLAKGRHEGRTYGVRDWSEHVLDAADIPPTLDESDSEVSSCESVPEE
ncbi:uncharacterized protein LOC133199988 [Saccostrea echinata]|uniref:uncharacterized protein LOC133199988 n=1 Tax=Saccostrea echinata TaxID=191078 RepID=UPI002A8034BF|nr:uncharacterized protein LOC133199988 [Saccostrea echinata]